MRWGFLTPDGDWPAVLPFATLRVDFAGTRFVDSRPLEFSEGLAVISRIASHRWQLVDDAGRTLAAARFDWLEDAGEGMYAFVEDGRWGSRTIVCGCCRRIASMRSRSSPEASMRLPRSHSCGLHRPSRSLGIAGSTPLNTRALPVRVGCCLRQRRMERRASSTVGPLAIPAQYDTVDPAAGFLRGALFSPDAR